MEELSKLISSDNATPRLWIERINIYNSPASEGLIRSVSLRPGINIIWAKEPADGAAVGIHANGHGVGKTSLCQLIRYCLADTAKAVTDLRDELQHEFSQGGVGAVIHLGEKVHSVFRFFNPHKDGLAMSGDSIDDLWGDVLTDPYRTFESLLSTELMAKVSPTSIPETGQDIEWRHLLAWVTRDQGTRFKSYYSWREGEGAGLKRPRQDPPLVMRAALGLMDQSESTLMKEITQLARDHEQSLQKTSQLRQEPELIRKRIESELRAFLGVNDEMPFHADDLFSDSVQGKLKSAREKSESSLSVIDAELAALQSELVERKAAWLLKKQELERAAINYQLAEAARNRDENSYKELLNQKNKLMSLVGYCEYGAVKLMDCSHIQNEISKLDAVSLQGKRDQNSIATSIEEWAEKSVKSLERKNAIQVQLDQLNSYVQEKDRDARLVQIKRDTAALEINRAEQLINELTRWQSNSGSETAKQVIASAEESSKQLEALINSTEIKLHQIKNDRSSREKTLHNLTNHLAQALLANEADGAFDMRDEDRPFKILIRGGEAYRVMEVLLGDLVCLFDSSNPASAFPGMIIHDCPREADMSSGMYAKFFHLVEQVENDVFKGFAPYQYIVTTTTPPPGSMQAMPYLREILDPSLDDGLLFKNRFSSKN